MIRKRIKKRRNPSEQDKLRERRLTGYDNLKYSIRGALQDGNPVDFVKFMMLYKRGLYCNDCDKSYHECRCDDCEECGFVECLCPLNIKYKGNNSENYTDSEKQTIKEEAYKFLIYILNDDLYNDGRKYNLIPNDSSFKKLKEEFLKSALNKSKIDLSRANLHKKNLSGINLSEADLSRTDLCEANLTEANLTEANLTKIDLIGANLTGADLTGANLIGALLNLTDLTGADLTGADLTGADLYKTNFTNAIIKNTKFNNNLNKEFAINLQTPNPRKKYKKIIKDVYKQISKSKI